MLFGINQVELDAERKIHADEIAKKDAEIAALKKSAEPKEGLTATKTVTAGLRKYYTFGFDANRLTFDPQVTGWAGDSDDVTVKRADHYVPAQSNAFADLYGYRTGYSTSGQTFKSAFTKSSARVTELETFLADLLTVDPKLNRFDAAVFSKKGKRKTPFKWNVTAVHDAAELIRSDKAEAERRDALKAMQEGGK